MRLVDDFDRTVDAPEEIPGDDAMQLTSSAPEAVPSTGAAPDPWPVEVDLILSAMEAASSSRAGDRRGQQRRNYRTRAQLRLFADNPLDPPTDLFTRDVHERGIGFITRQRLPLGYGGIVELLMPDGHRLKTHCTIYRCCQAANGWFEGALHFSVQQWME